MKHLLLTTIAALLVVGCGESQQSAPTPETKPEPPTVEAPDISIHGAAALGNIIAVEMHIADGVDVNAKDRWGMTPLRYAAEPGHKEIIELLIAKGADVNAKDKYEWTPLHNATTQGYKEITELLIAKGADVNANWEDGSTALDAAIKYKRTEIADLLRKHGGKTKKELEAAGN